MQLNIALNQAHQTGSMIEYVYEEYGVSKRDLDNLSNQDVSIWDKELKFIGLYI